MSRAVYQPATLQVERTGDSIAITRAWYRPIHWVVAGMAVFWDALSVFVTAQIVKEHLHWAILLASVANLAIAALMSYYTVVGFLNKTRFRVAGGTLEVWHGPLRWTSRGRKLPVETLAQLFVIQQLGWDDGTYYQLCAVLKDGSKLALVSGLGTGEELLFVEETLERYLHIEDQPVENEVPKT